MRRRMHTSLLLSDLGLQTLQLLQAVVKSFLGFRLLLQWLRHGNRVRLEVLSWRRLVAHRGLFQELSLLVRLLSLGQRIRFDLFARGRHRLFHLQLLLATHQPLAFYWLVLRLVLFIVGFLFAILLVDLLGALLDLRTLGYR